MPSRKSNASDATLSSSSRRSSLRRLSSIASFQNLFTRRRSQNVTDNHTAVSSSSDLSASACSSSVDTTLKLFGPNSSLLNNDQDQLGELPAAPPPTHSSNRRSSYICLPDDPIGGMPRSRTFSNLPVPTRVKKTPAISLGSSSHNRLPSDICPSTRLPSPSASTRKHSHSRLISGPPTRMKRSDTEPLLGLEQGYNAASLPRSTAFKENISLSPIKPLPALEMGYQEKYHHYSSSPHHPSQYQPPGAWISSPSDGVDALSCSLPSTASYSPKPPPPISKYASHPAIQMVRDYKSSPARPPYRSSRDRPPTPGASSLNPAPQRQPTQRWNSQPVLTARPNNHEHPPRKDSKYHKVRSSSSHSSEIKAIVMHMQRHELIRPFGSGTGNKADSTALCQTSAYTAATEDAHWHKSRRHRCRKQGQGSALQSRRLLSLTTRRAKVQGRSHRTSHQPIGPAG